MANPNIFQQFLRPVRSVSDYSAELDRGEANALNLAAGRREGAKQEQAMAQQASDRNALQRIAQQYAGNQDGMIGGLEGSGSPALMAQAQAMRKARLEGQNTQSQIDERGAKTAGEKQKNSEAARKDAVQLAASFASPDDAIASMSEAVRGGKMPMQMATAMERMIRSDPQWQLKLVMGANSPEKMTEFLMPHLQTVNAGGAQVNQAVNKMTGAPTETGRTAITQSADSKATQQTTIRGQNMVDSRARDANAVALSKPFEVTGPDGAAMLVQQTKDGKIVPVQGFSPKGATGGKVGEAKEALALLDQADSLIKGATGSTLGAAIDSAAQFFGSATPGSIKAQQLKAIEGALVAKMPKMSGPQSDKDVLLYRQMAAEIGDPTVPYERKAAAMGTVREIQERYAGMAPGGSKPTASPNSGGATRITDDAGYNALPSGATFIGPDGKTRRKP